MAAAVAVLVGGLVVVLLLMGQLGVGNSTDDAAAPAADAIGGLERAKAELGLPVVVPNGLPSNWQANSFQVSASTGAGDPTVVRAGWLTPDGRFVSLVQSTASPGDLVTAEIVTPGSADRGTATAGGLEWQVYPGLRDEVVWVRAAGPLSQLITGSASESDFQVLAAAVAVGS